MSVTNPERSELIWVTPDIAKEYNSTTDPNRAELVMKTAIKKLGAEVQTALEDLDEDILRFKARGLAYRDAYNEAFESEADSAYAIWKEHEGRLTELRKDAEYRLRSLRDLTSEVVAANADLLHTLERINTYQIEQLATNLQQITQLARSLTPEMVSALQTLLGVTHDTNN